MEAAIKESLAKAFKKVPLWAWYIVAGVGVGLSYFPAKAHMIAQDAWIWVVKSNVTVNFILLFFIWGMLTDRISKDKGWSTNGMKSWGMFFVGIIVLVTIFTVFGGYETIWDK